MYDFAAAVMDHLADANSSATLKGALAGSIGVVIAAAITAFGGKFDREPSAVKELREAQERQISSLQETLVQATRGMELRSQRIDHLERVCYLNGIDPDTGRKI